MLKNFFNLIIFLLLTLVLNAQHQVGVRILENNTCLSKILVHDNQANEAAKILQHYLDTIFETKIDISNTKKTINNSFVFCKWKEYKNNIPYTLNEGAFVIQTENETIKIYAQTNSAYKNAVYYFLENILSCRMYAADAIVVPKYNKNISIKPLNTIQNPSFNFRINHNFSAFNKQYAEWHGLHNRPCDKESQSFNVSDQWGLWVHTLDKLVSPDIYFNTHPEYFAERNGIRVKDQICLSNAEVSNVVINSLKELIKSNTLARYWSVSQLDNFNHCQCDKCRYTDSINGSASGSIIEFVNTIAKAFPDKQISTLAYQYSRKAPSKVKPLPNVNIMLCSIECNRNLSINEDANNLSFKTDIEEWGALTNNIIIWDYVINFSNILGPFPNFHVLQPNLKLFADNNVKMIFEQGWPSYNGEFTDLRCYLLTKLMWNVNYNTDSLMIDFCQGYYGAAGNYVYEYIKSATNNLLASKLPLTLYEPMSAHKTGFLSPENINNYIQILYKGLELVKDNKTYNTRVQLALQPLRYAWLEVAKSSPFTDNWILIQDTTGNYNISSKALVYLEELYSLSKKYGPKLFHEISISPDDYYNNTITYFNKAYKKHKGIGKEIILKPQCDSRYNGGSINALIDGVQATENYFSQWQAWYGEDIEALIDLKQIDTIKLVKINFLSNEQSWIFPPDNIQIEVSTDDKDYKKVINFDNIKAREKSKKQIQTFDLSFSQQEPARYIKIKVKNIGNLPRWRGVVDGKAWLFIDEIIIE